MDAPPPRKPGIKLKIPAGNVRKSLIPLRPLSILSSSFPFYRKDSALGSLSLFAITLGGKADEVSLSPFLCVPLM
jgi:hypothetical protein